MDEITIKDVQNNLLHMNLDEHDSIWNVRMPLKDCEICGGNAVAEWNGEDSILCDCLISTDNSRELMKFGVLWGLHCIKRKQVYNE